MNTIRVLMYGWEFPPYISGGLGMACHAMVQELARQGIPITLVLPEAKSIENLPPQVTIKQVKIRTALAPYVTGNTVDLVAEVTRYAAVAGAVALEVAHDVIHAHDWLTALAGITAKRLSGKPLVLHIHALETDRGGIWLNQRIFAIEKYALEQADRIIAVSSYTKNALMQHYGVLEDKIVVAHNGVYCETNVARVTKTTPAMVLFLGRLTLQKGPDYFISVANKILAKRPEVQFVLAGNGDLLPDLVARVASLRIGKNVHFTGFLQPPEVEEIFRLADVYVMPSVSEPFGLSCLEALAHNVPVVISKQSGVSEVMPHVLIVDYWDVDTMAEQILALLDCQALRTAMLQHSASKLKDVTWEKTAEVILKCYHDVVGNLW